MKISQFTKFGVVLLDRRYVEGFQKSEKLETLYGFGGRQLGIRDICMEFGRTLTAQSLGCWKCNINKPGRGIFLVMDYTCK